MTTLEFKDLLGIHEVATNYIKQGNLDLSRSLIKILHVATPHVELSPTEANDILRKITADVIQILHDKRNELDDETYKQLLELLVENSVLVGMELKGEQTEQEEFLTTGDVAKKIGVSNQTILNMIRDGRIKAEKLGSKHWRIPASQFREADQRVREFREVVKEMHATIGHEITD